jgi:hypothetical protein
MHAPIDLDYKLERRHEKINDEAPDDDLPLKGDPAPPVAQLLPKLRL